MGILLGLLLAITSIFLILVVLVQRGRGGGLAGALGGMGGQSAFGAKAGDVFTRITIGVAFVWIVLCLISVKVLGGPGTDRLQIDGDAPLDSGLRAAPAPREPGETPAAPGGTPGAAAGGGATAPAPATETP